MIFGREKTNMKNLVFMLDVDIKGDGRYASSRRASYKYSIDSWKKWCEKNDCQLFVLNDLVLVKNKIIGIKNVLGTARILAM